MNKKELDKILEQHKLWINSNGDNGQRANLQRANLQGANLQWANLQEADLQYANLQRANLQGANLQGANLQEADLQYANLQGADLQGANLQGANLQEADLHGANLDFSVFPLWCGSFDIKNADRLAKQLLAHVARMQVTDTQLQNYLDKIPKKYKNEICDRHQIEEIQ